MIRTESGLYNLALQHVPSQKRARRIPPAHIARTTALRIMARVSSRGCRRRRRRRIDRWSL